MSDRGDEAETPDGITGASIDFARLDLIATRLATDDRFERIEEQPAFAPGRVVCVYDTRLYPSSVQTARLEIVWFESGDFSLHYHEEHGEEHGGTFDHRWDRHPSDHNARDHVYAGPNAPTPGTDASLPVDWRDVLSSVLSEIEVRQRGFWTESSTHE